MMSGLNFYLRKLGRVLATALMSPGYAIWAFGGLPDRKHKKAWLRLVDFAGRQNLSVKDAGGQDISGIVYGDVQGATVLMRPDDAGRSMLSVLFKTEKQCVLSTGDDTGGFEPSDFSSLNKAINSIFKTRRIDETSFKRLQENPLVLDELVDFYSRWMWYLSHLVINEHRLVCQLRQQWFVPAIPVDLAQRLIPDMVSLAQKLDEALGASDTAVDIAWYVKK